METKTRKEMEMNEISYAIMDMTDTTRSEHPISASTDNGARRQAKKAAKEMGIKEYSIIFYRQSDGCRGWLDK